MRVTVNKSCVFLGLAIFCLHGSVLASSCVFREVSIYLPVSGKMEIGRSESRRAKPEHETPAPSVPSIVDSRKLPAPAYINHGRPGRTISEVVLRNDVTRFSKLLPSIPSSDLSAVLRLAVDRGSVEIVRGILAQWRARKLSPRVPISKLFFGNDVIGIAFHLGSLLGENDPRNAWKGPPASPDDYLTILRLLIDAGIDVNSDEDKSLPLRTLARIKPTPQSIEAARLLLAHGASTAASNGSDKATVFEAAARSGNAEMMRLLRPSVPGEPPKGELLVEALSRQQYDSAAELIDAGTRAPNNPGANWPAVMRNIFNSTSSAAGPLLKKMIQADAVPGGSRTLNIFIEPGSPLMMATGRMDFELAELLLKAGVDPNVADSEGNTSLHRTVRVPGVVVQDVADTRPAREAHPILDPELRYRMATLLLKHGGNPNIVNRNGYTPLMYVTGEDAKLIEALYAKGGLIKPIDDLLQYGDKTFRIGPISWALANSGDLLASAQLMHQQSMSPDDCGAVYYAAQSGATVTLGKLLDLHADAQVEAEGRRMTPILVAAENGNVDAVRLLLDRKVASVNDRTAIHVGSGGGHPSFPTLLGHLSPLMAAASRGHDDVVALLLARGADRTARDMQGKTALEYAHGAAVQSRLQSGK